MASGWSSVNRSLVWFHRWASVGLCVMFAIWFASGAVLHFVGFPSLPVDDQRAGGEPIDMTRVQVSPVALAGSGNVTDLKLISVLGQPVYAMKAGGVWHEVSAESGEVSPALSLSEARQVAERFSRRSALTVVGPIDYDQWIVHQRFDSYRPFYRVRLDDPARTDLYVSARTGEVLQRTRFAERTWNWVGAVIHWIYFTPLRKSWTAWNQVVWWLSLVGLVSSAAGTWLGFVRMSTHRATGRSGLSPFRGWMRWHHIIGIFSSVILLGWILSGWLSMDHGRLFTRGEASTSQAARLSAIDLEQTAKDATPAALAILAPATSIVFGGIAGHPMLTAYGPSTRRPRLVLLDDPNRSVREVLPQSLLLTAVSQVWPTARAASKEDGLDLLYRRAESADATAAGFIVEGDHALRVYVDPFEGRFVAVMDASRRGYAWIYYALHTLQFPVLIAHPRIRTVLVLVLLTIGFAFSVTGVVLGVSRVRRTVG